MILHFFLTGKMNFVTNVLKKYIQGEPQDVIKPVLDSTISPEKENVASKPSYLDRSLLDPLPEVTLLPVNESVTQYEEPVKTGVAIESGSIQTKPRKSVLKVFDPFHIESPVKVSRSQQINIEDFGESEDQLTQSDDRFLKFIDPLVIEEGEEFIETNTTIDIVQPQVDKSKLHESQHLEQKIGSPTVKKQRIIETDGSQPEGTSDIESQDEQSVISLEHSESETEKHASVKFEDSDSYPEIPDTSSESSKRLAEGSTTPKSPVRSVVDALTGAGPDLLNTSDESSREVIENTFALETADERVNPRWVYPVLPDTSDESEEIIQNNYNHSEAPGLSGTPEWRSNLDYFESSSELSEDESPRELHVTSKSSKKGTAYTSETDSANVSKKVEFGSSASELCSELSEFSDESPRRVLDTSHVSLNSNLHSSNHLKVCLDTPNADLPFDTTCEVLPELVAVKETFSLSRTKLVSPSPELEVIKELAKPVREGNKEDSSTEEKFELKLPEEKVESHIEVRKSLEKEEQLKEGSEVVSEELLEAERTLIEEEILETTKELSDEKTGKKVISLSTEQETPVHSEAKCTSAKDLSDQLVETITSSDTCTASEAREHLTEVGRNEDSYIKSENSSVDNLEYSGKRDKVPEDEHKVKFEGQETLNNVAVSDESVQNEQTKLLTGTTVLVKPEDIQEDLTIQGTKTKTYSIASKITIDSESFRIKMADLSEKLSEQQQENSDLKLQLNASQQAKASLELEIRQKEEVIIKTQAEALKSEQLYKQEIKQLREKLKENSKLNQKDNSKDLENQLKETKEREAKAVAALTQRNKDDLNYQKIMEEYENTIATRFADYQKLKEEHETATRHLANIELAFSDVHQKYERTKIMVEGFKSNEETLVLSLQASEKTCKQHEQRYESLKAHAQAQIEKSNKEIISLRDKYEMDINKLKAIIKRLEIKCSSLEVSLLQKTEECAALSALCDEVTGKRM